MVKKQVYGFKKSKAVGLCSVVLASYLLIGGVAQAEEQTQTVSEGSQSVASQAADKQETLPQQEHSEAIAQVLQSSEAVSSASTVSSETDSTASSQTLTTSEATSGLSGSETSQEASQPASSLQTSESASAKANLQSEEASSVTIKAQADVVKPEGSVVASGKTLPAGEEKQVTSATVEGKHLSLQYNRKINPDERIQFAVWSEKGGQDDLVWYQADVTGAAYIDLSRHKTIGKYLVHTYANVSGKMIGLNGRTVDVPAPSGVKVAVADSGLGQFKVTVTGVTDAISSVTVPVWSDKNGQDDLQWYKATKASNGDYTVTIKSSNHHGDTGLYYAHVYGTSAISGELLGLAGTTFTNQTPLTTKVSANHTDKGIAIKVDTNAVDDLSKVQFAVWSEVNGQDDLRWYGASKEGTALVPYSEHSGYGKYFIHTYSFETGNPVGLNGTSIQIAKPAVKTSITKVNDDSYKVEVRDVPHYISSVILPTWSDVNGQDDIQWVSATKTGDGIYATTISVRDHHMDRGHYSVHVYGTSQLQGNSLIGLSGSDGFSYDKPVENKVTAQLTDKGIAISLTSNTVGDLSKVQFAVWSDVNGQDDLRWYGASKVGTALVPYTDHTGYGKYFIHTYSFETGKPVGLNGTSIQIAKPAVKTSITKVNDVTYQAVISDVPRYISSVTVPTWSTKNGQDDIQWVSTQKDSEGRYVATINLRYHQFETGSYSAHVYGVNQFDGNKNVALAATEGFTVSPSTITIVKPEAKVENYDKAKASLTVKITESDYSLPIKSARIAAWSKADQSNLYWYNATPSNGVVTVNVSEKYHHYVGGDYTVHAYVTLSDGSEVGYNLGQYAFDEIKRPVEAQVTHRGTGNYTIDMTALDGIKTVNVAVWSDVNGQDDIKWYEAPVSNGKASIRVNVTEHKGTGIYHIHIYEKGGQFIEKATFNVAKDSYPTPYYSQRDGRWSGHYYGAYSMGGTACVPTSLAMVFTSLSGREILPTEVADYLYYSTPNYNKSGAGTDATGIKKAVDHYGYHATVLNSLSEIETALQEGYHVLGAVQNDVFVRNGSHEMVFKGYSNGRTYVSDPYTPALSGWYSVRQLWNEQSYYSGDRQFGAPFFKITNA